MLVSAIVAHDLNRVIGKDGNIPWYLSADLRHFKRLTLHHHIIMGRSTLQSIGRPLPQRTNIVLTRNPFFVANGCHIAHSVGEALAMAYDNQETEAFIIGGGEIYRESLPLLDRIYLTEVHTHTQQGDAFFPLIDPKAWKETSREAHPADEKNDYAFTFITLERTDEEE